MDNSIEILTNQLEEEKRKYTLLQKVSFELTRLLPLKEKLDNILQFLEEAFDLKHTILLIPTKDKANLKVLASRGFDNHELGAEIPSDFGIIGAVATNKKMMRISRLSQFQKYVDASNSNESDKNNKTYPKLQNSESLVAIPLIANNELVAVLSCESEDILFFSQKEVNLLMTLSNTMAVAIQNTIIFDQLEERVKSRTKELTKLNETKDQLFSIIAHDLRSPLSGLEGISDLFEFYSKSQRYSRMTALSHKVVHATKNIAHLLDNLLHWSLSQKNGITYSPTSFSIQSLLSDIQPIFTSILEHKQLTLNIKCKGEYQIYADYNMVFIIVRNILSNAIKFSPKKSRIDVIIWKDNDHIFVRFTDFGTGISDETMQHLFSLKPEKSKLGTNQEKGSGLGLILVKEYLRQNKGNIKVDTSSNGTSFTVSLPTKK